MWTWLNRLLGRTEPSRPYPPKQIDPHKHEPIVVPGVESIEHHELDIELTEIIARYDRNRREKKNVSHE